MPEDANQNDDDTRNLCGDSNTTCVPISSCPLLEDLLDVSCFSSDRYFHRFNSLICDRRDGEDYVCCPSCQCQKLMQMPGKSKDNCGRSMVQGQDYEGLGAHPWVARIGFTTVLRLPRLRHEDGPARLERYNTHNTEVKSSSFRYSVSSNMDTGNVRFACAGSIIFTKVVLTAAHCAMAEHKGYQLSTVVVGEWDIGRSPDCNQYFCAPPTQAIKVDRMIIHPGYEAKIFRHDIALLVLEDEIKLTVTAAPVCLSSDYDIEPNEMALLVGWGELSGQKSLISHQQILELPIVPLEMCQKTFEESVPVQEGHLCAGGEEGKDACTGFGGAPLLLRRGVGYEQVGLVSFGSKNCGGKDVPSVYTNIPHYYTWIIENSPS
ncbi:Phenoloxidase-activating factor 3 [Eumeta japonica]|uniref:Phenoloxidase-activating factor 3 n=1 Tax=Eumeta variegata TaxID=151549 RepID=A0A4C1V0M2_EUMVA|nr:Phenoloxidase-activating factor 3 [Eumeta japonica]